MRFTILISFVLVNLIFSSTLSAQSSTFNCASWEEELIGTATGSSTYQTCGLGTFDLTALAYQGLGSTTDNQVGVYQPLCGDGEVIIHLSGISDGTAGIELRESLDDDAVKVALVGKQFALNEILTRSTTGGAEGKFFKSHLGRNWFKLKRLGGQITTYASINGTTWFILNVNSISMANCIYLGVIARSTTSSTTATASLDGLSITGFTDPVTDDTEINFASTSVTALPGSSVNVCVDISEACDCNSTVVKVKLKNSTPPEPHLVDFSPVWLNFDDGSTQECFTLPIGNVNESAQYKLILKTPSGGNNAFIGDDNILTVDVNEAIITPIAFCGEYRRDPVPEYEKIVAQDRFSNYFSENDLEYEGTGGGCGCDDVGIETGFFNLTFQDCLGSEIIGFHPLADIDSTKRRAVCRAFATLSDSIIVATNPCTPGFTPTVNIDVQASDATSITDATLAAASPYFASSLEGQGLHTGYPWQVINGGVETFPGLNDIYHGFIIFQPDENPNFLGWYADEDTSIPFSSNKYDLYTVALHEAIHVLGFRSNLSSDGSPSLVTSTGYDRFDTFLYLSTGDPVIANNPSPSYNWEFNVSASDLYSSCQDVNGDTLPDMVFKTLAGTDVPVFTGDSPNVSEFSHLNSMCDSDSATYIMSPELATGVSEEIHPHELEILCSFGYRISGSCSCNLAGVDDFGPACLDSIYVVEICPGDLTSIPINIADLIGNDPGADSIILLEPFRDFDGSIEVDSGGSNDFIFTPERFGTHILRYIPVSDCSFPVNETFVYVEAVPGDCDCEFLDGSEVNCGYNNNTCNLLCNPEFCFMSEINIDSTGFTAYEISDEANMLDLPGWGEATPSSDVIVQDLINYSSIFDGSGIGGFTYVTDTTGAPMVGESIFSPVKTLPGDYLIGFYSLAGFRGGASPSVRIYLGEEEIQEDYFQQFTLNDLESFEIEDSIQGQSNHLIIGDFPFPIDSVPGSGQPLNEVRLGTCFSIPEGEEYDLMWFTPQIGTPYPSEAFPASFNQLSYYSRIDQVELIPDYFTAGDDVSLICGQSTTLGGEYFCMLSEVVVEYTWYEEDDQMNLNEVLSYTVEIDWSGEILVDGVVGNIPSLTVTPAADTRYVLERTVINNGEIEGFTFCQTTDDVLVSVSLVPLDASFTVETCGQSISLVPIFETGVHEWQFGDSSTPSTDPLPVYEYSSAGTYQIIHTLGAGACSESDTVSVTIPDVDTSPSTADFTATVDQECDGILRTVTLEASDPNWTHTYEFDTGLFLSGESHILSLGAGNFDVTHTVFNDCDTLSMTTTVQVLDCLNCDDCLPANTLGVAGDTLTISEAISNSQLNPNGTVGEVLCIEGTLLIADFEEYFFNSCQLRMQPGSAIVVEGGGEFYLEKSTIHGCDIMWKGMEVYQGGVFKTSGNYISDALFAIYVHPSMNDNEPKADVSSVANTFDNNYISFFTPSTGSSVAKFDHFVVANNFYNTDLLLPSFTGQNLLTQQEGLPDANKQTYAGIYLNELGIFSSSNNDFEDLTSGIVAYGVNLAVTGNSFTNMLSNDLYYPGFEYRGIGLSAHVGSSNINVANVLGCTFDGCRIAVSSAYMNLTFQQNTIDNVEFGMTINLPITGTVKIGGSEAGESNDITAGQMGLWAAGFAFNSIVEILNNTIEVDSADGLWGIGLFGSMADAKIDDNIITINERGSGIDLLGVQNAHIGGNTIQLQSTANPVTGIALRGSEACRVTDNTITGAGTTGDDNVGIKIASSPGNEYCCNILDETNIGIEVLGASISTDSLRATVFNDHSIGLRVDSTGIIGSQGHMENEWGGSYVSGFGAVYDVSPITATLFRIIVDTTSNSNFFTSSDPNEWMLVLQSSGPLDYCNEIECDFPEGIVSPNPDDELIALDSIGIDTSFHAIHWELKRWLYKKIALDSTSNTSIESFRQTSLSNGLADYYEVYQDSRNLFSRDSIDLASDFSYLKSIDSCLVATRLLDALQQSLALPPSSYWLLVRSNMVDNTAEASETTESIFSDLQEKYKIDASSVLVDNSNLSPSFDFDSNEKDVNKLFLTYINADTAVLSTSDSLLLVSISNQCPLAGGNGVYRARVLLAELTQNFPSYEDNCTNFNMIKSSNHGRKEPGFSLEKKEKVSKLSVHPNPAKSVALVVFSKLEMQGTLNIFDQTGRLVDSFYLPKSSGSFQLNLEDYAEGVYILDLTTSNFRLVEKLIVN